jgi:Gpi18-like mannosyltransferase
MEQSKSRNELLATCLLLLLYIILLPRVYMEYDMGFWRQWALAIHEHGVGKAYQHGINYLPVFVYALYVYDLLQGTANQIATNINSIKILFVIFDFLPIIVLLSWGKKLLPFAIPQWLLLFNIAYLFNSMVWGQIDSIYTNLSFLAIIFAMRKPAISMLLYLVALNTKPQAIEFLPVLVVLWWLSRKPLKTFVLGAVACTFVQASLVLPFILSGSLPTLIEAATTVVGRYNKLSICAFNFWYLVQPNNPYFIDDSTTFLVFSYRQWGMLLFGASLVWILVPLAKHLRRLKTVTASPATWELVFLGTGLICLYFFYFNAQMHERYAHPIVILFFFYSVASGNYALYILASIAYFLSLDKCFPDYLPIVHYKFIFASKVIALWYTATVVYGTYLYYKLVSNRKLALP